MANIISGPGLGLPYPGPLYPPNLNNTPYDVASNYVGLAGGDVVTIPSTGVNGYAIDTGAVSLLQYLDPVTGVWRVDQRPGQGPQIVTSDGFTRRIANLTGCPVSAVIAGGGSGFAQATTTITANVGGSTWQAIVGGSLSVSTVNVAGAGYTMAPIVHIAAPPSPGIPATAHATIASGTVASVVLDDVGAGYISVPGSVILPNPVDPNAGSITQASVTLVLNAANAGAITGALCTNNGAPLSTISALTLTAAGGAGTGATITPQVMQCVTGASVVAGGGGWGVAAVPPAVTTAGGGPSATSAVSNPMVELTKFRPRPAQIGVTSSSVGLLSAAVVTDPGLFISAPTPVIVPGGTVPTTLASIALTLGSYADTVLIQPL